LNLTWECLEGLVKHNGPLLADGVSKETLPEAIADFPWDWSFPPIPAWKRQIAALSDDIAM